MSNNQNPNMDEALRLYQASDFSGAADRLRDLVAEEPKNFDAWRMLGFALNGAKDHEAAIKAFETAVNINKRDADVYFGLGLAHQALGQHRPAIAAFEKCLHENHHHPAVKIPAADSYEQIGKEMEEALNLLGAEQYYEKAYQYSQREDYYNRLLEYYERAGQGGKAMMVEREWRARHGQLEPEPEGLSANATVQENPPAPPQTVTHAAPANPAQPAPAGLAPDPLAPAPAQSVVSQPTVANFFNCPACHKPMAMTANMCPHCGHDIRKPLNSDFTKQKKAAEQKTWQEIVYKIMCGLWILFGILTVIGGLLVQRAFQEETEGLGDAAAIGGTVGNVAAAMFFIRGGLQIIVGIGLLFEVTFFMWIGYVMCLLNIFGYGRDLLIGFGTGDYVSGIISLVGLGLTFLFIYLLKFFGDV